MKVHILGTSSAPHPSKSGRGGTGVLVSIDKTRILFDCGPGVTEKLVRLGIDLGEISTLFLTHHHYDHTSDIGLFVLGRWEWSLFHSMGGLKLAPQLAVYGPPRTKHMIELLFGQEGFFQDDVLSRINGEGEKLYALHGVKTPIDPPMPVTLDIQAGDFLEKPLFKINTVEAEHCQPYLIPLAFRFDSSEGSVVFSGDTGICERVTKLASGADLLIHDCSQTEETRVSMGYEKLHSSPITIGKVAAEAGVKKLVALHFGMGLESGVLSTFEDKIRKNYDGEILIANDMDIIDV